MECRGTETLARCSYSKTFVKMWGDFTAARRTVVLLFAVIGAIVLVAVALQSGEAAPAVASILLKKSPRSFQLRTRPVDEM